MWQMRGQVQAILETEDWEEEGDYTRAHACRVEMVSSVVTAVIIEISLMDRLPEMTVATNFS